MSCLIWLPLNGDLRNNGLLSVTPVQSGGSFVAGKTGKCFDTDGSGTIKMQNSIPINKEFTFSVWVNMNEMTPAWARVFGLYYSSNDYIGLCLNGSASSLGFHVYSNVNGAKTNIVDAYAFPMGTNEWHHITVTCDSNNMHRWYYDSSLVWSAQRSYDVNTTYSLLQIGQIEGISSAKCNCKVCDFRFYDTALSPYEIKLLSQGLVLHYPLDRNGLGGENIISGTYADTATEGSWAFPTSGYSDKFSPTTIIVPSGSNYVLSFDAKSTVAGDKVVTHFYIPNTTTRVQSSTGFSGTGTDGYCVIPITTVWKRYWVKYTQSKTTTVKHVICPQLISSLGTGTVSIRMVKLEAGTEPTPWCPSNITDTTVYDTSGFGNNGTATNVTYDGDTARYTASSVFNGSTSNIALSSVFQNGQTITELTVCEWFNTTTLNGTTPNLWSLGENAFHRLRIASATSVWFYSKVGTGMKAATYSCKTLTDGNWHQAVFTFKDGIITVYIDGDQIGTSDFSSDGTYLMCSSTSWHLGGYTTMAEKYLGKLSDFRIYATALSADEIKDLFDASAKVHRDGTMYAYSYVEF